MRPHDLLGLLKAARLLAIVRGDAPHGGDPNALRRRVRTARDLVRAA